MKFSFVFLLLLDVPHLRGQLRIEEFEHILLRFAFPSFYNSYNKYCCKLYPGGCYKLLDSAGYTCDLLRGRVTKTEDDGWIEFKISNVNFADRGYYRCIVLGTSIYSDYSVEVSEVSVHHSQSQPPLITTVKVPNASTTPPDSPGPAVSQEHSDSPRDPWSFDPPAAVIIVPITAMILIASVVGVICYRVQAKRKQSEKHEETLCESVKLEAPVMSQHEYVASETSSIVYTTVGFRAHQKPTEVYANLGPIQTETGAPDRTCSAEHHGMVEYSTLAVHQLS